MGAGHLPSDSTGVDPVLLALGAVDKGHTLPQVPLGLSSRVHTLQLHDAVLGALQVLSALVTQVASFDVETMVEMISLDLSRRNGMYRILFSAGIDFFSDPGPADGSPYLKMII